MDSGIPEQKKHLRAEFLARRRALSDEDHAQRSANIRTHLESLDELRSAHTVHAFWPIHENREVDIRPFLRGLLARGIRVVLPRVRTDDSTVLDHRLFLDEKELVRSGIGVFEPVGGSPVPLAELDAVLVPALSVAPDGVRLGYGGGHYDRFLDSVDIPCICPIFDMMIHSDLPREDHDARMDVIVTEKGCFRPL